MEPLWREELKQSIEVKKTSLRILAKIKYIKSVLALRNLFFLKAQLLKVLPIVLIQVCKSIIVEILET